MLKKTMTYIDFDGNKRTEDFYFNLTRAEIIKLNMSFDGGLDKTVEKIVQAQDYNSIYAIFEDLVRKSYGEKSNDGKRFIKTPEILDAFVSTQAYSDLIEELSTDAKKAADFFNAIVPSANSGVPVLVDK